MDSASDARRFAAGPLPSHLVRLKHAAGHGEPPGPGTEPPPAYDPLRLCIFATIALLGWAAGPVALAVFAAVGFAGYWKARRRGLTKSKCFLRDTRLVLVYLGALLAAAIWGIYALVAQVFGW